MKHFSPFTLQQIEALSTGDCFHAILDLTTLNIPMSWVSTVSYEGKQACMRASGPGHLETTMHSLHVCSVTLA